jgi:hypothetical protein
MPRGIGEVIAEYCDRETVVKYTVISVVGQSKNIPAILVLE